MHIKRHSTPKKWKLERKKSVWAPKTTPGPHRQEDSVPIRIVLRDMLGVASSAKEVKQILSEGKIQVDKTTRKDDSFPLGLFDVLTVGDQDFRMTIDENNRFSLKLTDKPSVKPVKVIDASSTAEGKRQLHLSDGTNLEGSAETGSTLLIKVPGKEIIDSFEMKKGNLVLITKGKHAGQVAEIKGYKEIKSSSPNRVTLERDGEHFSTVEEYVFVVGETEPEVEI